MAAAGKQILNFSLLLPDDLVSSMMYGVAKNVMNLSISYKLVAEFMQIETKQVSQTVAAPQIDQQDEGLFRIE